MVMFKPSDSFGGFFFWLFLTRFLNLVLIIFVYLRVNKTIEMKRTLTRQDFEVIVDAQIYFVNFTYEETFFTNHSADPYEEPVDITTSEETVFEEVISYDENDNKIISKLEQLPKKHQQVIIQKVQEDCNAYASV